MGKKWPTWTTHFWMEVRLLSDRRCCQQFRTKDLIRSHSVEQAQNMSWNDRKRQLKGKWITENIDIKTDFAHLNSHFIKPSKLNDREKERKKGNGNSCSVANTMVIVHNVLYTMFEILSHKWGAFSRQGLVAVRYWEANWVDATAQCTHTYKKEKSAEKRINKTYESVGMSLKRNKCEKHYAL